MEHLEPGLVERRQPGARILADRQQARPARVVPAVRIGEHVELQLTCSASELLGERQVRILERRRELGLEARERTSVSAW